MIIVVLLCFIIFYLISVLSKTIEPRMPLLQSEPVSCTGHFGTWSPCNGSTAERERVYTITREEANGGDGCEHNHGDTQRSEDCRVDCLGEFGTWTPCDGTTRGRVRTYTTTREQANGGDKCDHNPGDTQESDDCSIPCLGEFGSWSACDGTTVRREKTYIITQQAANGGDTCDYEDQHTESETDCPVNCAGDYGTWGPCDRTTGTKQRIYRVTRHALNRGASCAKPDAHTETTTDCPVDCAGDFGTWSPCDKIATKSVRVYRVTRQEANGGDGCDPYMDGEVQESTGCPVDCVGDFGTWSPCDRSSTRKERAYQVSRHAVNGGDTCYPHADGDTQTLTNCPVDCVGDFGTWSPCDGSSSSRERAYRVTRHAVNGGETCYPHTDGDTQTLTDCLVACNIEGCNSEMLAYINTSDAITALWDNQLIEGCRNCPRRHVTADGKWNIGEDGVVTQISVTDNDLLYALIKIPPNTAETCNINTCNTGMAAQTVTHIIDTSNIEGCEGCPRRIFKNGFLFRDGLPIATAVGDDYWYSGSALHEGQKRVTSDHLLYWEATAPYFTCENPSLAAFIPCTYLDFVGNRIFANGYNLDHRANGGTTYRLGFTNKNKNNTKPYNVDPLTALGPITLEINLDAEKMQQCEQHIYIRFRLAIPPRTAAPPSSKCNHYEPWSDTGRCTLANDKIVVKMFPGVAGSDSTPAENTKFGYTFQIFQNKFSASKLSSGMQLDGDASRAKFEENFMNDTPHNFEMMYRDFGTHGKTLLTAIDGQIYEQITSSNSFSSDIPSDTTSPMRLIIRIPQQLVEVHEVEVKTGDFEWPLESIVFS